jgi:hypothetical protein
VVWLGVVEYVLVGVKLAVGVEVGFDVGVVVEVGVNGEGVTGEGVTVGEAEAIVSVGN